MLTYRTMAAGAPSEAAAYAAHLLEQTLDDGQLRLASYYGRTMEATMEALELGMGSVPLARGDMDPALAAALGITPGALVKEDALANILGGRRADGEELPVSQANVRAYQGNDEGTAADRVRISGMDLCISAPKSVSLAWMAAADDGERAAILQAHRQANAGALAYVEQQIGRASMGHAGEKGTERGRLAWITIDHFTARPTVEVVRPDPVTGVMGTELHTVRPGGLVAGDPQLHSHNIVPNIMVTESGRLVAVNRNQLRGRIHEFGAVYQALLAANLRRAGIHVELDEKTQTARIPCIPERACKVFSKRSQDGEEAARAEAQKRGMVWDSMTPDQRVAFLKGGTRASRRSKADDLADAASWRETMKRIGWKHTSAIQFGPEAPARREDERLAAAHQAAGVSLDPELGKRAVLTGYDVRTAAARGLIAEGIDTTADVSRVTKAMAVSGVRQDGGATRLLWREGTDGKVRVTTELHRDQEAELVRLVKSAATDRSGALTVEEMRAAVHRIGVRFKGQTGEEQVETVKKVGQAGKVAVFIGAAGVGKTTRVLPPLVEAWKAQGRDVWGAALAWRQASALKEAGIDGMKTRAIQPFIDALDAGKLKLTERSVVVIDELSQVGTRQLLQLMRHREAMGFTVVMTGDPRQCQSVEAGPVIDLLRTGLGEDAVPQILTVVRQDTAREREIASMFRGRDGEGEAERLQAVKQALGMKREDGTAELVEGGYRDAARRVAALYMERVAANRATEDYSVTVSAPTNADALFISREIRALRRAAGSVGEDRSTVQAQDGAGNAYAMALAPGDRVRLFQRTRGKFLDETGRPRSAAIGDNGSVLEVVEVLPAVGLRLRTANGKVGTVEWAGFRERGAGEGGRLRLAYGDCLTIDAAQGITSDEHIAAMPGGSSAVQGLKGYVAASRHRRRSWLVVSKGMELREVEDRRPMNAPAPADKAAEERVLWDNVARNLARQPIKESAMAMLSALQQGAERAGAVMREGARRVQARVRSGAKPARLREAFRQSEARRAVAALGERLEAAMAARAPLLQRLAALAAAAKASAAPTAPAARQAPPQPRTRAEPRRVDVSEADAAVQLAGVLKDYGLQLKGAPIFDGEIHYVGVAGNRGHEKSGAYKARSHATLGYVASIWNWKSDAGGYVGRWSASGTVVPISPEEAARREAEEQRKAAERAAARVLAEAKAAAIAQRKVSRLKPAPADHPYLVAKGLDRAPDGVLVDRRGNLIVPLTDASGRVRSFQTILPDGGKLYLEDAQKIGVYHMMGEPQPGKPILVVEGLATGGTVRAATGNATAVALDTSNLLAVGLALQKRYPDSPLAFAADNDHHLPRRNVPLLNAGKVKAERAAEAVGGRVLLAPEQRERTNAMKGTDWNDMHALRGLDAVRDALRAAWRASETPAAQAKAEPRAEAQQRPGMRA